jgi:DNA-directed RNA polymerase subunit RPC12/RpoP
MPYRETNKNDWLRVGAYLLIWLVLLAIGGAILIPLSPPIGLIIWLVLFAGTGLLWLVRWHSHSTGYRCSECGAEFEISALVDFISPQVPDKKYLKCPQCGKRAWDQVLMKNLSPE